jgi:hypothetical protein
MVAGYGRSRIRENPEVGERGRVIYAAPGIARRRVISLRERTPTVR